MSDCVVVTGTAVKRPGKSAAQAAAPGSPYPITAGPVAQAPAADAPVPATLPIGGKALAAAVSIYCLLVGVLFYDTLTSMVTIWLRSQTFAHGFLILPISLWLAWRLRGHFGNLSVKPEPRALLLVLAAGLAWLLAHLVDVQVIQQLAFVAVLVSGIWSIVGTEVARCYAFPLGFVFLAVPMGAGLIPPLMAFTADTTEFLLRASGIPVFREGMYLSLPTGTWSVIEECSGVRYLIASFTLGLLYSYLTYKSLWRRAGFMVAAIVAPILANSVRAYGVVMVGHLSDMRYGIGGDHLVFGWVFFGLVMLLIFWIGSFWQQPAQPTAAPPSPAPEAATPSRRKPGQALTLGTCLAVLCASTWPALALTMNRNDDLVATDALATPAALGTWEAVDRGDWQWRPGQRGADRELNQVYATTPPEPFTVGLHIRQYLQQHQGVELVTSEDVWRPDRQDWRVVEQNTVRVELGQPIHVDEAWVASARENLLVWSWYRIDGSDTANPYMAKLLEAKQQIVEGRRHGARVFVATPMGVDSTRARKVLHDFVTVHHRAIETSLTQGIGGGEPFPARVTE